jgi:hypothetical protein
MRQIVFSNPVLQFLEEHLLRKDTIVLVRGVVPDNGDRSLALFSMMVPRHHEKK